MNLSKIVFHNLSKGLTWLYEHCLAPVVAFRVLFRNKTRNATTGAKQGSYNQISTL